MTGMFLDFLEGLSLIAAIVWLFFQNHRNRSRIFQLERRLERMRRFMVEPCKPRQWSVTGKQCPPHG